MSPLTGALIASELLPKVVEGMTTTPASWLATGCPDEIAYVSRHCQTLRYLQTCYDHVLRALPVSMKSGAQSEVMTDLIRKLDESCRQSAEKAREVTGIDDDHLKTVPKYYFSELRNRRKCTIPQAPANLTEESTLAFLSVEAVAGLRRAERFDLLARERGVDMPKDRWESMARLARRRATDITATLVRIFGEKRTEAHLQLSVQEESKVMEELLDRGSGRLRFGSRWQEDAEDEDEDADDSEFCDISVALRPVFIVSDCTGESAQNTVNCALAQFGHCFDRTSSVDMEIFRFCTESDIDVIVEQAKERGAFIVYTLVDPIVNAHMVTACQEAEVEHHDLWGRLLEKLEGYFDVTRTGVPGKKQVVDEKYMQMIECIEFTRTLDDGVLPHRWHEADIIILGPSRTGKTPLSFFMAQRGYKVANYPIVPDESLPKELWDFDQARVFALTIEPAKLSSIRSNRMRTLRMGSNTQYAQTGKIQQELAWVKRLYEQNPKWTIIDTTYSGIEESAAAIMKTLDRQGFQGHAITSDNPSAI